MNTTTTPHPAIVALPPAAVTADDWQPDDHGGFYRCFDGEERGVVAGTKYGEDLLVEANGVQRDDGSIEDGSDEFFSPPSISIYTVSAEFGATAVGITLTGEAARRLADALVTAADEVDRWATR